MSVAPSAQPQQPPATPTYILRGHAVPIHALQIFNQNLRLVSGDADGWIVVWDLIFKRPVAVWKAHEGAILEVKGFSLGLGVTEIYTHGRDHKLRVWRFRTQDEEFLQKTLPVDIGQSMNVENDVSSAKATAVLSQPWLVHSLMVNALNFCAFSMLFLHVPPSTSNVREGDLGAATAAGASSDSNSSINNNDRDAAQDLKTESTSVPPSSVLIAVPNALDSGAIDLFHLPQERRICTIPADTVVKTGMVMAAHLSRSSTKSDELYVAAAYEDGHVMVFGCRDALVEGGSLREGGEVKGKSTRGGHGSSWKWEKLYACRPHTQPVLSIDVFPEADYFVSSSADAMLVKHPIPRLEMDLLRHVVEEKPSKSVNTKHAGQQGLRIRSDGKIFATAGWDSRVRVYSCKTMKELAVLKWHKEGCYSVAFAEVFSSSSPSTATTAPITTTSQSPPGQGENSQNSSREVQVTKRDFSLAHVQRQRSQRVQNTHWLVAGSKDGKISLWDIY